jgi:4a-hydroxytetrahydrobiopterin dehydratase
MDLNLLMPEEVERELAGLNGWQVENGQLVKKMKVPNFAAALDHVNKVGELAEAADHHPDIKLGWGYAEYALTTHDRGGITDVDFALARKIDAI